MAQESYQQLPSLERLNVLVGEWNLEFIFPDQRLYGREDFEWMKDRIFLADCYRSCSDSPTMMPSGPRM